MKIQFLGHTSHISGAQTHGPVLLYCAAWLRWSVLSRSGSDGMRPSAGGYGADRFFQVYMQRLRYSHGCVYVGSKEW